jgi:hypothetical protein
MLFVSAHQLVHICNLFKIRSGHAHENLVVVLYFGLDPLANVVHCNRW